MASTKQTDILKTEQTYLALNAEMEAKTAELLSEVDSVLRDQEERLLASARDEMMDEKLVSRVSTGLSKSHLLAQVDLDDDDNDGAVNAEAHKHVKDIFKTSSNKNQSHSLNQSLAKKSNVKSKIQDKESDVFLTEFRRQVANHITDSEIHQQVIAAASGAGESQQPEYEDSDVLPAQVGELNADAQIRLLKAKLRVTQEEVTRLQEELRKRVQENGVLNGRAKVVEDERIKLGKTLQSVTATVEKQRKALDEAKGRVETLESSLNVARKELDQGKRQTKQINTTQNATEVRLNRAVEEAEKARAQLAKCRTEAKEAEDAARRHVEQLQADNRRLEKQKTELLSGFKKQLRLIDVLRRQRMHLEAAKMLQFSEEEFVKALDWGN